MQGELNVLLDEIAEKKKLHRIKKDAIERTALNCCLENCAKTYKGKDGAKELEGGRRCKV